MRLRYPKITYAFVATVTCGIVGTGLILDYAERRTWPPSVPNSGSCIIADSRGDTQARANQLVAAVEQFVSVNKVAPGSLRQLTPTYIDKVLAPVAPIEPWSYRVEKDKSWTFEYVFSASPLSQSHIFYTSKARKWDGWTDNW